MDRAIPLLLPYIVKRGDQYIHPMRYEAEWPKKVVLISTCGYPERHHFAGLLDTFRQFSASAPDFELVANITCAAGGAFSFPDYAEKIQWYVDAARCAGREVVEQGCIMPATEVVLERNLIDPEQYCHFANAYFDTVLSGHSALETAVADVTVPDALLSPPLPPPSSGGLPETFYDAITGQSAVFNPAAAGDLCADLLFCVTGQEPGEYVLRIAAGRCTVHTGKVLQPALTVHTPSEVWLQIARGELSGPTAYMQGLFRVEGDMRLLMRMGELFPRQENTGQEQTPAERKGSTTALAMAYCRGYHAEHDMFKLFDDFLAYSLLKKEERASFAQLFTPTVQVIEGIDPASAAACRDQAAAHAWYMQNISPASLAISRARYTEDNLAQAIKQGVGQYVILGAGLDTFAFRHPELMKQVQVFEIDHPATQASKRRRVTEAGLTIPAGLHFLPVDFTKESLATALVRSAYDRQIPTFFSWLGVTYYLSRDAVLATLRDVADIAPPGSVVMFDYFAAEAFMPGKTTKRMQMAGEYTRQQGEPIITGFDLSALAADLAVSGLRLQENLTPADIDALYFRGRTDGYHAFDFLHIARAVVE